MLDRTTIIKFPASLIKRYRHLRDKLTPEELRTKSALEIALGRVKSDGGVFKRRLGIASEKVKNYEGDPSIEKYFKDYLESIRQIRKEYLGYNLTSSY